jgi:nicotinamidase-related amidase
MEQTMTADYTIERDRTALLFVDPYNDFFAEGGKLWPLVAEVAKANGLLGNLRSISSAARNAGLQTVIVPHHRADPSDFEHWDHPTPYQLGAHQMQIFAKGNWGGDWFPEFAPREGDLIATEHWGSSGFANTNLDSLLKQRGVSRIILIGLIANTCIETTAKYGVELGYHVTLVRDATAAASPDVMRSAHDINAPTYAHAVVTTDQVLAAIAAMI